MSPEELKFLLESIQNNINKRLEQIPEYQNYKFVFVDLLENDIRP